MKDEWAADPDDSQGEWSLDFNWDNLHLNVDRTEDN